MLAQTVLFLMCTDEVPGLALCQDSHNKVFIVFLTAQASVINAMTTLFLVHYALIFLPFQAI
jgi:hypothetical protein